MSLQRDACLHVSEFLSTFVYADKKIPKLGYCQEGDEFGHLGLAIDGFSYGGQWSCYGPALAPL